MHIKLNPRFPIDTLIINAAECELFITPNYREILENTEDVIGGIRLIIAQLGISHAKLAIEAIRLFTELTAEDGGIDVITLLLSYPQGVEKVIVYNMTGRIRKLISGGPMMGISLPSPDMPVVKTTNGCSCCKKYSRRKKLCMHLLRTLHKGMSIETYACGYRQSI